MNGLLLRRAIAALCLMVALVVIAMAHSPQPQSAGNPYGTIASRVRPSCVMISHLVPGGYLYRGSGFVVAPNVIATCAHIVSDVPPASQIVVFNDSTYTTIRKVI